MSGSMAAAALTPSRTGTGEDLDCRDKLVVPEEFFKYIGPADTECNSLYQCLLCATSKPLSCNDKSRQNLRKHISVSEVSSLT
jgi:hypothetical protein